MDFVKRVLSRTLLAGLLLAAFTACASAPEVSRDIADVFGWEGEPLGRIAILPFSGGSTDEREGIAELFSYTQEMMRSFLMIPRTGITKSVEQEQSFQTASGMTDADTIAKLGEQFGANYVMAGSITSLGDKNLLIVSIIEIAAIRQVAGDYLIYDSLDAIDDDENILENMAKNLVKMARNAGGGLDKLALLPVELQEGGNKEEGDALAQILAIHLLRNGKYAVYPRTMTLEQVQNEYKTQQKSGVTRADEAVKTGQAVNPPYALSVISRKIGTGTRFNASIIEVESNANIDGGTAPYNGLSDGINAMESIATTLSH